MLADPDGLKSTIDAIAAHYANTPIDYVAGMNSLFFALLFIELIHVTFHTLGMEARGFIVGTPLAIKLGVGFIMLRKPNKLPGKKITFEFSKEYGKVGMTISNIESI